MTKTCVQKVMLVDDSEIDLFIQKRFLEVYHFSSEIKMYTSANEAIAALSATTPGEEPEAIFLDLNMPDADGFSFLEQFKALPDTIRKKSRIVVLTSSESNIDRDFVLTFKSVIHFITKPLKNSDIEDLKIIFQ